MYVYFIQRASGGPIKIGKADRPDRRLTALQVANPDELKLLAVCLGGRSGERAFHEMFSESRIRNEWFEPTPRLLAVIARLPTWDDVLAGRFVPEVVDTNDTALVRLFDEGYSYADIGELLGVSRQRAHQVVRKGVAKWQRTYVMEGAYPKYTKRPKNQPRPPQPTEPISEAYRRILADCDGIEFSVPAE